MSRHVEIYDLPSTTFYLINDMDIPEIENPEDRTVLWIGSLDAGMVIYNIEDYDIQLRKRTK